LPAAGGHQITTHSHAVKFSDQPRDVIASLPLSSRRDHTGRRNGEAAIAPLWPVVTGQLTSDLRARH